MTQSVDEDQAASAPETPETTETTETTETGKGVYVYGILPGDIEMTRERTGVGDPPGQVRIVRSEKLAALVSDVELGRPLGSPDDLTVHKGILDDSAVDVPVLPLRFGAVLVSDEAVVSELLTPNDDEFSYTLDELDGCREYVIKGRYDEREMLESVLAQDAGAARLSEQIRGADPDATRDARIQLGELISKAIAAQRARDTELVQEAMSGHCVAAVVREPTHELDAVHLAVLLDSSQEKHLDQVIRDLSGTWAGRVELRVLGPQAPYDFVGITPPGGLA